MEITQEGAFLLFVAGFAMFIATSYRGFTPLKTSVFVMWLVGVLLAINSNALAGIAVWTAGAMGGITMLVIRENRRKRR